MIARARGEGSSEAASAPRAIPSSFSSRLGGGAIGFALSERRIVKRNRAGQVITSELFELVNQLTGR